MSNQALNLVRKIKLTACQKFVLFVLAEHLNDETGLTYPSNKTLCDETCLSRSSVIRAKNDLIDLGIIERPDEDERNVFKLCEGVSHRHIGVSQ